MNLAATILIYAGGPGSGCHGPNCGRPTVSWRKGSTALRGYPEETESGDESGADKGTYYHGTSEEAAEGILRTGLKPNIGKGTDPDARRPGMVYLSRSAWEAGRFALENFKKPVIIEIRLPDKVDKKVRKDDWTDYMGTERYAKMYKGEIPSEHVTFVDRIKSTKNEDELEYGKNLYAKPEEE